MKKIRFSDKTLKEFTEEELNALLVTKHGPRTLKVLVVEGGNREVEKIVNENGILYAVLRDYNVTGEHEIVFTYSDSINFSCFSSRNI